MVFRGMLSSLLPLVSARKGKRLRHRENDIVSKLDCNDKNRFSCLKSFEALKLAYINPISVRCIEGVAYCVEEMQLER